jgi:hypothetical protein
MKVDWGMYKCLKEKCPHFKEYETYRVCRLIDNEILDECVALQKKREALEIWGCKISKFQAKISALEEVEQMINQY